MNTVTAVAPVPLVNQLELLTTIAWVLSIVETRLMLLMVTVSVLVAENVIVLAPTLTGMLVVIEAVGVREVKTE